MDEAGPAEPAALGDLIDLHATILVAPILGRTSPAQRRGGVDQRRQRDREETVRRRAAEVGRDLFDLGWLWTNVVELLGVPGRTLRHWCRGLLDRFTAACPLGRPRQRSDRGARNEVIHFLDEFGPGVGVSTLRECFPAMCRAELEDLLKRYRGVWRERNRQPLRVLSWPVPGRVWAIDYAGPVPPIDGQYPNLLAVRDLASGMQLLWQPVEAATGDNAAQALATLFACHGVPLVLKSDNGGPFTCPAVQNLLQAHQIECLFSPPQWPRYNGAIEAGIGAMKDRTDARAARAGHAGYWTSDDTAGALREANALARPQSAHGASPNDVWAQRSPIGIAERDLFRGSVKRHLEHEKQGVGACFGDATDVWSKRAMARHAIRLALEECEYLHYTRRRILPPIPRRKAASIT